MGILINSIEYVIFRSSLWSNGYRDGYEIYEEKLVDRVRLESSTRLGELLGVQSRTRLYEGAKIAELRNRQSEFATGYRRPFTCGDWILSERGKLTTKSLEEGNHMLKAVEPDDIRVKSSVWARW